MRPPNPRLATRGPHSRGSVGCQPAHNFVFAAVQHRALLFLILLLLGWPPRVSSQVIVRVTGTVSDPSGAALPGARVTAHNEQADQTTSSASGADGNFVIDLPAGVYTIAVSAPHYSTYIQTHFTVSPGAANSLRISLARQAMPVMRDGNPPHRGEATLPSEQPGAMPMPPPPPPPAAADHAPHPPTAARPPASADHSVSGRSFLVGNTAEEPGFGLYSYLLFSSEPVSDEDKQRDLAVIKAFVDLLSDVADLRGAGMDKSNLNVTYLLVVDTPQDKVPAPDWILSHYDYARAKVLLHLFHHDVLGGPYVASCLTPLSQGGAAPAQHLWQDMSHVPGSLAASWEKEFERRAGRKDFWASDTRNQALLGLRDFISTTASALPEVNIASADFKTMLADWLSWK